MDNIQMYPLDNRYYSAQDVGMYHCTRTAGVFSAEENLRVSIVGDFEVSVSQGMAWLRINDRWGTAFAVNENTALEIEQADGLLDRYDAITISYDRATQEPSLKVKEGEYATDPQIPKPMNDDYYVELVIAAVYVPAGATAISTIVDTRLNAEYCGIMRDGVTGIPTQSLFDTWEQAYSDAEEKISHYWQSIQNEGFLQPDAKYNEIGNKRIFDAINDAANEGLDTLDVYVDVNGNDSIADGTQYKPFRQIQSAVDAIPKTQRGAVSINVTDDSDTGFKPFQIDGDRFSFRKIMIEGGGSDNRVWGYGTVIKNLERVEIEGMIFAQPSTQQRLDVLTIQKCSTAVVNNCDWRSSTSTVNSGSTGVFIDDVAQATVSSCSITRCGRGAVGKDTKMNMYGGGVSGSTVGIRCVNGAIAQIGTLNNSATTPYQKSGGAVIFVDGQQV